MSLTHAFPDSRGFRLIAVREPESLGANGYTSPRWIGSANSTNRAPSHEISDTAPSGGVAAVDAVLRGGSPQSILAKLSGALTFFH